MKWFLYILRCGDDSLYTGITTNIVRRIGEHSKGKGSRYLRGKLPVKLVYQESCDSRSSALKREAEIKKFPRKKKLAMVKYLSRDNISGGRSVCPSKEHSSQRLKRIHASRAAIV